MPDPIALVPLPRSVVWSEGTWETTDPWEGQIGRASCRERV